jgi:hypothetical protein
MAEHEKEIQELKERVKYLEGVIEGMARAAISRPLPVYGPIFQQPMMPAPVHPYWPQYTVTC